MVVDRKTDTQTNRSKADKFYEKKILQFLKVFYINVFAKCIHFGRYKFKLLTLKKYIGTKTTFENFKS